MTERKIKASKQSYIVLAVDNVNKKYISDWNNKSEIKKSMIKNKRMCMNEKKNENKSKKKNKSNKNENKKDKNKNKDNNKQREQQE